MTQVVAPAISLVLDIERPYAYAPQALLPVIKPALLRSYRRFFAGTSGAVRSKLEKSKCWVTSGDSIRFPAYLLPNVEELLRQASYAFEVRDLTPMRPQLQRPWRELLAQVLPWERCLLEAVMRHPAGIIRYGAGCSPLDACVLIAKLYPYSSILVAVPNRGDRDRVVKQLKTRLPTARGQNEQRDWPTGCVVAAYGDISPLPEPHEWDLVLFPYAESAHNKTVEMLAGELFSRHCYALHKARWEPEGRAEHVLKSLFCDYILDWVAPTHFCAVKTCEYPIRGNSQRLGSASQKRLHIWRNEALNLQIAALARELDSPQLGGGHIDVGNSWLQGTVAPALTVLVESPEHAGHLSDMLPNWRVLTRDDAFPLRDTQNPMELPRCRIVTLAAAEVAPMLLASSHAVIDATMATKGWRLDGFPPTSHPFGVSHIALIRVT